MSIVCDDAKQPTGAKRRTWAAISLLDELLERACPSIQYRLRWEVLGESRSAPHLRDLHGQILNDAAVQEVFSWQQPDGWLCFRLTCAQHCPGRR